MTQQIRISEIAPVKVNLFLHVTGRRDNGYHDLESLVSFVTGVHDTLTYMPEYDGDFQIKVKGPFAKHIPITAENIVFKTLSSLCDAIGIPLKGHMIIDKHIPVGAGLGGGSSDAAAALRIFQSYFDIQDQALLYQIAEQVGADVPVCLFGKTAYISGIGEKIEKVFGSPPCPIILVKPKASLKTVDIFNAFQGRFASTNPSPIKPPSDVISYIKWLDEFTNSLQETAENLCPEIHPILQHLMQCSGCHLARMTGSGPTCFALFDTMTQAENAAHKMQGYYPSFWVQAGYT